MANLFKRLDEGRLRQTEEGIEQQRKSATISSYELSSEQKLLNWLQRCWTKSTVTARDIYAYGPYSIRDRRDRESMTDMAEILVKHGWLIPIKAWRRDMRKWQVRTLHPEADKTPEADRCPRTAA